MLKEPFEIYNSETGEEVDKLREVVGYLQPSEVEGCVMLKLPKNETEKKGQIIIDWEGSILIPLTNVKFIFEGKDTVSLLSGESGKANYLG